MKQVVTPILLFIFLALSNFTFAQSCECVNCPRVASSNSTTSINFAVAGASNNDLSDPGQGVCGVYIEFAPDHIWSLEMILTSPAGQQVTLIGPPSNTGFFSGSQTWEILFLPCSETVEPDPGFPDTWNNSTSPFSIGSAYDGSYYPYNGCLEDFDTGSVDGNWNLSINNISPVNGAFIWDFKVIFCDDSGLDCFPCDADPGSISTYPDILACPGDPSLTINMNPDYGLMPGPDPNLFGYTFAITENDVLLDYDMVPDLTNYPSGTYTICGLSYLLEDSLDVPGANGVLTLSEIEDDLAGVLPPFCGAFTDDCLEVIIQELDSTFISETICNGETYPFDGQDFDSTGTYYFSFPGGGPCGRVAVLDLVVLDSLQSFIQDTICSGEEYCIGTDCFSSSGDYQIPLTSSVPPFCDSIVNLSLTVVSNPIITIRDTICFGDSVVIKGEAFFETGNYNILPDPLINCDTFFRLRLFVIEPILDTQVEIICVGDSLDVDGQIFDSTGIYQITYSSFTGCDSVLQIDLTVLDSIVVPLSETRCAGDTFWIEGIPFYESGNYEVNLNSYLDCDSLVRLDLTIQDSIKIFISDTICDGEVYKVGVDSLQATGSYEILLPSSSNCDTFATIDLLVLPPIMTNLDSTICEGETVRIGAREYNETGTHLTTLTSVQGCDSIVQLELTVLSPTAVIAPIDFLGCENNPVRLDASNSTGENLIYQWIDLDNGGAGIIAGADSSIAFVNLAGTYQLIVTDTLNGVSCSTENFVGVAGDLNPPTVFTTNDTLTCTDTTLQLDVITLSASLDFLWSGPGNFQSTIQQPVVNEAGDYTLITTGSNQCRDTSVITIYENITIPELSLNVLDSLDCATLSIPVDGNATGDIENYLWTGPGTFQSTNPNITVSVPGAYTFSATTSSGCVADSTIWITLDTIAPVVTVVGDTIYCEEIDAQLSTISADPLLLYYWEGPNLFNSTLPDPTVLTPGVYNLTVTATNACTSTYSTEVAIDTIVPTLSILGGSLTCDSTSIQLTAISDPGVLYSWIGPGSFDTGIADPVINEDGTYYLTVTSSNNCIATDSIFILRDTLSPGANTIGAVLLCNPDSVQIFANSPTFGSSFYWTGPGAFATTDRNPFVFQSGNYNLVVTGPNGCTSTSSAVVTADTIVPDIFVFGDTITCTQPVAELSGGSATSGASFLWSGPAPFIDTSLPNPTTNLPGIYTFTVIGANGCESVDTVEVYEDLLPPDIFVAGDTLDCLLDSIQLQANTTTPDVDILWIGPSSFLATSLEPFAYNAGAYVLTLTAANGCTSTDTAFVVENKIEPGAIAIGGTIDCTNDSLTLSGNAIRPGIVDYLWNGPSAFSSNLQNPTVGESGTYILQTTGANGCSSLDTTSVVEDKVEPGALIIGDTLTCEQDTIQLLGIASMPGVVYQWEGPDILSPDSQDQLVAIEGEYILTTTGSNGCTSTDTFYVISNIETPDVQVSVEDTINCNEAEVELIGSSMTSDVTYSWEGPGIMIPSNPVQMVGLPGEYILTIISQSGCLAFDTVQVAIDTLTPDATASGGILGCGTNATVSVQGTSSSPGVSYSWTDPTNAIIDSQNLVVSIPGNYILTVTAPNGCQAIDTAIVVEDNSFPGAMATVDTLYCGVDSVQLVGSSPTSGVNYTWVGPSSFFATIPAPFTSQEGLYTLLVTGVNGCESQFPIEVIRDTLVPILSFAADTLDCLTDSIQVLSNVSLPVNSFDWTGPGGFSSFEQNPYVQTPGNYTLSVIGNNYCLGKDSLTVVGDFQQPDALALGDTLNCNRDSVTLQSSSQTVGVSYVWDFEGTFFSTNQNPTVTSAGEYFLTVVGPNGCQNFDTTIVVLDTLLPIAAADGGVLGCLGGGVELMGTASGSVDSIFWTGPGGFNSGIMNPIVFSNGTYLLEVTGLNGCVAVDSALVIEDLNAPGASIVGDTLSCTQTTITLLGSADSSSVSYLWTGPDIQDDTLQNQQVSIDGIYTLVTTGLNGCTSTEVFALLIDTLAPNVMAVGDTLSCTDSLLQVFGNSSTLDVDYLWAGPGTFDANTQNPIVNETGEYILTVTASNGCSAVDTARVINAVVFPDALASTDTLSCRTDSVQLVGLSTMPDVSYSWTGPGTYFSSLQNPYTDQPGEYIFEVLNEQGCKSFDTVQVTIDTLLPGAEAVGGILDCSGGGVTLQGSSATPNVDFYWEGPGGFIDSIASPNVLVMGNYFLTVTAANGCMSTDTAQVTEDLSAPGANILGDTLNCSRDSIQLIATSNTGVSFTWEGPGAFTFDGTDPFVSDPGVYTLTVLGTNGCDSEAQFEVIGDFDSPGAVAIGDTLGCIPDTLQVYGLSADTSATYYWTGPGFSANAQNPEVTTLGEYILLVTGNNGCTSSDTALVIEEIILPDISTISDTINCRDTIVQIFGSSTSTGVTYSWEGPGGYNTMEQNPLVDTVGEYILTVLNSEGCRAKDTIIVGADNLAPSLLANGDTLTCADPVAQLSVSSSSVVTYEWEGPNGFSSALSNPNTTESGKYVVTLTAENFCVASDSVLVLVDSLPPGASIVGDTIDCTSGPFFLMGNATVVNPQFYWEGPGGFSADDQDPIITTAGSYFLTVTGSNGCISQDTIMIVEDISLPQVMPVGDTLNCQPDSIQIFSNSSTPNVTFDWSGPNSFSTNEAAPFVNIAGTYELVVTSQNGCTTLDSAVVISNQIYPLALALGDTLDCDSTEITLQGISDSPDVSYSWLTPNGSSINEQYPLISDPGQYVLIVNGQNQCVSTDTILISKDDELPQISATGGILNCTIDSVLITGSSATPMVSYLWEGPGTFQSDQDVVLVGEDGIYTLTVEGPNGCPIQTSVTVAIDTIIPAFQAFGDTLDCTTGEGTLFVTSSTFGDAYTWTGPTNFMSNLSNPVVDEVGQYQVVVTGANTCQDSAIVEVIEEPNVPLAEAGEAEDLDCNSLLVGLDGSASVGDTDLSYLWLNENGIIVGNSALVDVDTAGIYYLQVTNPSNNCSDMDSLVVAIDTLAPLAVVDLIGGQSITCAQTSIVLDGTGSIAPDSLIFNWWYQGAVISTEVNPEIEEPGTYALVVTNAVNACSDSTSFEILLDNNLPNVLIITPDTLNCYQDSIFLDASNSDLGAEYELQWFSDGPVIIAGDTTAMPLINQPGSYTLSILNTQNGCRDSALVDVFADFDYPIAEAGEGGEINCQELVFGLNGVGSSEGTDFQYLWNGPGLLSGENSLEPLVNQAGLYLLAVFNEVNGCESIDSVIVEEGNLGPANAWIDIVPSPCFGDEEGIIYIDQVIGGEGPYLYSLNGAPLVSWSQFEELAEGTYTLSIQDVDGCELDTILTLVDPLPLVVQLGQDTLIQIGEEVSINPVITSSTFELEWEENPFLECDTCLLQNVTPFRTSRFLLTVTDQNGCTASDDQRIFVEEGDLVYVPSAFSPDGDGVNDFLEIFTANGVATIKTFLIFDRWGEVVHERTNFLPNTPESGWDGQLHGKPMNPAVFVYYAEVELLDGSSKFFEGSITLMR